MRRFLRGFRYAWAGIVAAVRTERNFRFHLCAAAYVLWFSQYYTFTRVEYALLALCIGGVMALELVNSAVERAVDKPDTTHWWSAGAAKDMAAGAVLITALGALVIGCCLLLPQLSKIMDRLLAMPWLGILLLAALIPAYLFIFRYHNATQKGETTNGKTDS